MATDYVKEHPNYVRGVLEDAILDCANNVCDMCGADLDNQVGCHYQCKCGNHVTCSD